MKTVAVLLADGFEEIEALTPVDYLRRAGLKVTMIGVTGPAVTGSHGIQVRADAGPEALDADWDCVVAPGGMPGAANLAADPKVVALMKRQQAAGRAVAAICAAPAVLLHAGCGLLAGRRFTGYPGTETKVTGAVFVPGARVVRDGNLVTSRGPGTAGEFAIELARMLAGAEAAETLAAGLLLA